MNKLFFISDTHFWHKNVIAHCARPFESVEAMNEQMIVNWNAAVDDKDDIWHLGDVSFGNQDKTREILERLNGRKHLIRGNHDEVLGKSDFHRYFESVQDYKEMRYEGTKLVLCHYPILSWNQAHRGSYMLHGHCHGTVNQINAGTTRIDVGVDNFDYAPVSITTLLDILWKRTYAAVDHHQE